MAAADLVDNSIAAGAREVRITFEWGDDPRVVVADNGTGMNRDQLIAAMRIGCDPRQPRAAGDLGRFGLGMKTASLSQAQSLTVVTRSAGGQACAARWNLARIEAAADWELEIGSPQDLGIESDAIFSATGTAVIWESLDRLLGPDGTIDTLYGIADEVTRHLGMTFHRFIADQRTAIFVNDAEVAVWDPLALDQADDTIQEETLLSGIRLRGCILPSPDGLDEAEAKRLAGPNDWLEQQGFYIYREDRIIVAGGWLGIGRSDTPWRLDKKYNLARLSIDLDNKQDDHWALDILKSTATPPAAIRPNLYEFASRLRRRAVQRAKATGAGPGSPSAASDMAPIWMQRAASGLAYRLNRRHPLVAKVRRMVTDAGLLRALLDAIERTAPLHGVSVGVAPIDVVAEARQKQAEADLTRLVRTLYPNMRKAARLSPHEAKAKLMEHPSMHEHESFITTLIETLEKELKNEL